MANRYAANRDARAAPRDEVMHRAAGSRADGSPLKLVIVNISATGMMARCDATPEVGSAIAVDLPILGRLTSEVRWALGGRIGCEFDRTIPLAEYYGMLSTLLRSA